MTVSFRRRFLHCVIRKTGTKVNVAARMWGYVRGACQVMTADLVFPCDLCGGADSARGWGLEEVKRGVPPSVIGSLAVSK